jgi:hypothetical protein
MPDEIPHECSMQVILVFLQKVYPLLLPSAIPYNASSQQFKPMVETAVKTGQQHVSNTIPENILKDCDIANSQGTSGDMVKYTLHVKQHQIAPCLFSAPEIASIPAQES